MPLFARRPAPAPLPLVLPRLDGTGWTADHAKASFEASTHYENGCRQAYEPTVHVLADRLLEQVLPGVVTGASAQDAPYLEKVLRTAARLGAGIGVVERVSTAAAPGELDRGIAGALGLARRGLPAMQPDWERLAAWFLLAGHFLARHDPAQQQAVLRVLVEHDAG
ncbi:hypothetical protein BH24ACT10_BH24ACT10_03720 [soil metagenome]